MHVEVRNACASEEICACKSKCLAVFLEVKVPGLSSQSMLVQQVQQVGNGIFPRWDEKFLTKDLEISTYSSNK